MKDHELISLGLNWCLTTKKKKVWRSEILEVVGRFNDEDIFPLFFIVIPIEQILCKYENWEQKDKDGRQRRNV